MQAARETRQSASTDVLTGISVNGGGGNSASAWDAKHASCLETVARQMASGRGSLMLEGRVGDCCGDDEVCNIAFTVHLNLCLEGGGETGAF